MKYFIPRNSRFYSFIAHTQPSMRYTISALCVGCISGIWYLLLYRPIELYLYKQAQHMDAIQKQMQHICCIKNQKQSLEKSCTQLQEKIIGPTHDTLHQQYLNFILPLIENIRTCHMHLVSYTVTPPQTIDSVTTYAIHMTIKGTMTHYMQWLQTLQTAAVSTVCTHISCTYNDTNNCTMQVDLQCFFYTPQSAPKEDPSTLKQAEGLGG